MSWIASALLNARGEFVAGLRYSLMKGLCFFLLVGTGAMIGHAGGVAWAVCAYYVTSQPTYVWLVYRRLGIGVRQVAKIYLRPAALAAVAVGLGLLASTLPWLDGHLLARVLVIGVIGMALYAALVRWLAAEVWNELHDRVAGALRR